MKKYANLPGIIHIDAIEQTDREERSVVRSTPAETEVNTETY